MISKSKSTKELWIAVKGYEGIYEISNKGRVKSLARFSTRNQQLPEKILKRSLSNKGYVASTLRKKGIKKKFMVHRLVAQAFIPNPENKSQINHKNGTKHDNRVSNLEWSTASENMKHAYKTGLNEGVKGERNSNSKLTKSKVLAIRANRNGLSQRKLAEKFGVCQMTICKIINKQRWAHI